MKKTLIFAKILFFFLLLGFSTNAFAETIVILMPGKTEARTGRGILLDNRTNFSRGKMKAIVAKSAGEAKRIALKAKKSGNKIAIVGMSLGAERAADALRAGAPADGVVFLSGDYRRIKRILGSPSKLPAASILIHHRSDDCPATNPSEADPFKRWSGGKVKRIVWITTTGDGAASGCRPSAAHGFYGKFSKPVSAAIGFVSSL